MPVQTLTGELMGTFPRLPYLHALQLVNRAWARVRDLRLWSWQLVVDAQIYTANQITAGTVTVNQFATTITVDATAAAAINAAPLIPPVASPTIGQGQVIRVGVGTGIQPTQGGIYNITNWDGASQLTIDRPFAESSMTAAPYRIYRAYFAPPALPFGNLGASDPNWIRPVSFNNRMGNYSIRRRRMFYTQEELSAIDPQRASTDSYAWGIAPYQQNGLGQPTFEFYPHPVLANVYSVTYYSRWPDLSTTVDLPQVPYGLSACVMDLARAFCCQWAMANAATYPELQQTNWVAAMMAYKQDFTDGLKMCIRQDDEMMPQVPWIQGRLLDLPLGGSFLQNHDITGLLRGGY
jgi:hypothetical protein